MPNRTYRLFVLIGLILLLGGQVLQAAGRPAAVAAPPPAVATADGLLPLPESAGTGLPDPVTCQVACISGYVILDGQAVANAKVTIAQAADPDQFVEVWTRSQPGRTLHYPRTDLSAAPLDAQVGDELRITARYGKKIHSITHRVLAGGQQVDIVLPRNQDDDVAYERQIWQMGATGTFQYPQGIAIDAAGAVYVVDRDNLRVQVFNRNGRFLRQWGSLGNGPGQFFAPHAIATDRFGNVYVTDTGNQRVQKFTNTGTWLASWGDPNEQLSSHVGQFYGPLGIAVDETGLVYVTDYRNHRVQRIDPQGNVLEPWQLPVVGGTTRLFNYPTGVAVDRAGTVYVADSATDSEDSGAHRIQKFNRDGNLLTSWTVPLSGTNQLTSLTTDSSGIVYAAYWSNYQVSELPHSEHGVKAYTSEGQLLASWGRNEGPGHDQVQYPQGVAVDSAGNLYISDQYNQRIQQPPRPDDPNGPWSSWGTKSLDCGRFATPDGIAMDAAGTLYVADAGNGRVQMFDAASGSCITWFSVGGGKLNGQPVSGGNPQDVALGPKLLGQDWAQLYVAIEGSQPRIEVFTTDGVYKDTWWLPGRSPIGIIADPAGNVYVADRVKNDVLKFSSDGTLVERLDGSDSGFGPFKAPRGVAVDASGTLYVADTENARIMIRTADGVWLEPWGKQIAGCTQQPCTEWGSGPKEFSNPGAITIGHDGYIYVGDSGNHRVQKFTSTGTWLSTWGTYGAGDGQFYSPGKVLIDAHGALYVADTGNQRIAVFHPMRFTRPIATIVQATPRSVRRGEMVQLAGMGGDSDATPAIAAAYRWTLDSSPTPFAQTPQTTLDTRSLAPGRHTISLQITDGEGERSDPRSVTIDVTSDRPAAWTFWLYLDADNDGIDGGLNPDTGVLARLRRMASNPDVRIVALYDGPDSGDSAYYVQEQPGGALLRRAVNPANEVNMGDPQTLIDFFRTYRGLTAADAHSYLAIADHANGVAGIAWDTSSGPQERLTNAELRAALGTITENGGQPIDVLHLDGCLMGLVENAYELRGLAHYLISSENLAWSAFAYDRYSEAARTPTTNALQEPITPAALATAIVDRYAERVATYPFTIAALDLEQLADPTNAVDRLAAALVRYASDPLAGDAHRTQLAAARAAAQAFDSNTNRRLDVDDAYIDLADWAERLTTLDDSEVRAAAQELLRALPRLVLRERHGSGHSAGVTYSLDQAHGVAIYYPPSPSDPAAPDYHDLAFPTATRWDEFLAVSLSPLSAEPSAPLLPAAPLPLSLYLPIVQR